MSVPIPFPDPARGDEAVRSWRRDGVRAVVAALAVAVGTMALGVLAGLGWAAVAPRPLLVMTSPGAAALVNTETNAFIAADAAFCLVCLAVGVVSGVLGYLFAVRRHGPLAMAGLVGGALAAAFVARWVGNSPGWPRSSTCSPPCRPAPGSMTRWRSARAGRSPPGRWPPP